MSMYPPGVTGREVQIAGMPEGEVYVECHTSLERPMMEHNDRWSIGHDVERLEAALIGWQPGEVPDQDETVWRYAASIVTRWKKAVENEVLVLVDDCGFEGKVDAQLDDEYAYADCPRCGADIEWEHGLYEPDPDAGRDE